MLRPRQGAVAAGTEWVSSHGQVMLPINVINVSISHTLWPPLTHQIPSAYRKSRLKHSKLWSLLSDTTIDCACLCYLVDSGYWELTHSYWKLVSFEDFYDQGFEAVGNPGFHPNEWTAWGHSDSNLLRFAFVEGLVCFRIPFRHSFWSVLRYHPSIVENHGSTGPRLASTSSHVGIIPVINGVLAWGWSTNLLDPFDEIKKT